MNEYVLPPSHISAYLSAAPLPPWADWPYRVCSPGRVNLIGEHIDYTGGLVLPAAIDYNIYFAARPLEEAVWKLHAVDLGETIEVPLPLTGPTPKLWANYLVGIGVQFQEQGHQLSGLEVVFGGNLPNGAGMSSSAALEGGMAFLLNELLGAGLTRPILAAICQRSSNNFLGIPCGVMDQFASLNGSPDGPIILNCHTLTSEPVRNEIRGYTFLLVNSKVSHDLSDGAYGQRVAECQRALEVVHATFPRINHLSATLPDQLSVVVDQLDEVARKRASYVVEENRRVSQAVIALEAGNAREFGTLLNESHAGLRDCYEVSCPEIDFLQHTAMELEGVAGTRMMGGGFGGCTINLVRDDQIATFKETLTEAFEREYGITPEFYPVHLTAGTRFI
ncbi:galactokinase [Lewinella marina]|uniref:Galactokinase n=1 Tax=Neolewinella marina TaxID=438751 RepID=A0A2G0CFW1_9BACT|nr:galactokinase [Neolewinella marina]NJB85450.1 galactokinase [Neolewinella marina]PHK98859.1 galactokinase [Neolewinella marina]